MPKKTSFSFLCDHETELECLEKQMVGTTQENAIWAMSIKEGDDIYLFNFNTGLVRGPYSARSSADCYDRTAWGGRFPVQVRIYKTNQTRQAYVRTADPPSFLKKKRPTGAVDNDVALLSWLTHYGEPA